MAILICSGVNINMLSRGGGKFVLLVNRTTHVFARGAGNFELFWWKKEGVVQRGVKFVLLVNKTLHVFAREGGKYLLEGWQVFAGGGGNLNCLSVNLNV